MAHKPNLRGQLRADIELDVYVRNEGVHKYPGKMYHGALEFNHLPEEAYYVEVWQHGELIQVVEKDEHGNWVSQ